MESVARRSRAFERQKLAHAAENALKHRMSEPPRLRVLLARMIRGNQNGAPGEQPLPAVAELRHGVGKGTAVFLPGFEEGSECNLPQGDYHMERRQKLQLLAQIRPAVFQFLGKRLVLRRSTAESRGHEALIEPEPVVSAQGAGLVCKARGVQRFKEPVPTPVAGEHSARSISPMGCRCQPDDKQSRISVSECRNRTTPILLVPEATHSFAGHALTPLHEARALSTPDDGPLEFLKPALPVPQISVLHHPNRGDEPDHGCIIGANKA
jgi:hypothetical protein